MAGQSIAKLAILLTTDTTGMVSGFRRGAQEVQQFERTTLSSFSKMATKGAFKAVASAMFDGFRRGADALMDVEDRLIKVGADGTNALSTQWKLLQQNIGDSFAGVASRFAGPLKILNSFFENKAAVQQMRAMREHAEKIEKHVEKWAQHYERIAKLQEELTKNSEESRSQATGSLAGRAASLAEQFSTPTQAFNSRISELEQLLKGGFIGIDLFERAAKDAANSLNESSRAVDKFTRAVEPVGAVERHTMAGFSAAMTGGREGKRLEEEAKKANDWNKQQTAILQNILNKPGVSFQIGRL